jgi:hypothetical protein
MEQDIGLLRALLGRAPQQAERSSRQTPNFAFPGLAKVRARQSLFYLLRYTPSMADESISVLPHCWVGFGTPERTS